MSTLFDVFYYMMKNVMSYEQMKNVMKNVFFNSCRRGTNATKVDHFANKNHYCLDRIVIFETRAYYLCNIRGFIQFIHLTITFSLVEKVYVLLLGDLDLFAI